MRELLSFLENELLETLDKLDEKSSQKKSTFALLDPGSRAYNPRLRNLIMDLQQHNVADSKICTIIGDFAHAFDLSIHLAHLPSLRTIGRIGEEAMLLGLAQVGEMLVDPENEGALALSHDVSLLMNAT